nr:class I SAM-dependent methyltransferase [uncultured Shinella sp.]
MSSVSDHALLMDRIYRWQRRFGIYDATRKYYLLGRDPLLAGLAPPPGGCVLEIGCGTGRNLVKAAGLYPQSRFHGIDISQEMLVAAEAAIAGAGLKDRVRLARADAAGFDPQALFGQATYDRIFISYAVSMIPQWQRVMEAAIAGLSPGGALHIADFGDMRDLPRWFKNAVDTWLGWHHVTPRADLFEVSSQLAAAHGGTSKQQRLHRGFSWLATIHKG